MNKYFISTFITALLALSNAESDTSERFLQRGGGDKLAKLQNMIDTECTASFSLSCPDDDPTDDDCTFEKPERPRFTNMSQDEIQQLKKDYRAMRQERKQQLLVCACCGGYSLDEMLPFAKGSATATASGGLVCLEEAALADLALKELKGQDFREVEANLGLEDLVGVEDCVEDEVEVDVSGGEVVIPLDEKRFSSIDNSASSGVESSADPGLVKIRSCNDNGL
eukprot:scaffold1975_cov70-Skeletonema_dohrnii-CCMP3373.AAC.2